MKPATHNLIAFGNGLWKSRWWMIWGIFFLGIVLMGTGCNANGQPGLPKDKIQLASESTTAYTAIEKAANDLRDEHVITEQQHAALKPARDLARAALLAYQTSVLRGDSNTATAYQAFTAALAQFTAAVQQMQAAGPATRP